MAKKECCICRKNKTKKGGSNYEKLTKCVTEKGAENLQKAAELRKNVYLTTEISNLSPNQIISKEYQYHESCRKKFLNIKSTSSSSNTLKSFDRLLSFVKEHVIDEGQILRVRDIAKKT